MKNICLSGIQPCIPHLESVLIKCSDQEYRFAKIIRIVPSFKYEVSFLGDEESSRALVELSSIKNNRNGTAVDNISALDNISSNKKSSESASNPQVERQEIEEIEQIEEISFNVLSTSTAIKKRKADSDASFMPKKKRSSNTTSKRTLFNKGDNSLSRVFPNCSKTKNLHLNLVESNKRKRDMNNIAAAINALRKECEQMRSTSDDYALKNRALEAEKEDIKTAIKKLELNCESVKKTLWCKWCLEKAPYECCFQAAYCSEACQESHWLDGHYKNCMNGGYEWQLSSLQLKEIFLICSSR